MYVYYSSLLVCINPTGCIRQIAFYGLGLNNSTILKAIVSNHYSFDTSLIS